MNDDPASHVVEDSVLRMLDEVKEFARREPAKAVAISFGVGLLVNLLPTRVIAGAAATVGATLMRPALLSLGVIKAVELCCQKPHNPLQP